MYIGRLLTAMVTPFNHSLEVDYSQAKLLAKALINSGSEGLVVTGTTGENPTLDHEENFSLWSEIKKSVGDNIPIIAGSGTNGTRETIKLAQMAEKAGADYITYSPVFETSSKPGYGPPAGLAGIKEASAKVSIPVVALAGIKPSNVKSCIVSGARGVAVMGGVMQSLNPGREVEELIAAIK